MSVVNIKSFLSLRAPTAKRLRANGDVTRQGLIGSTMDNTYFASVIGASGGGFFECYKDYTQRTQIVISPPNDTPLSARIAQTADGTHWTSKNLAICETPEVHELPLASGFPAQSYANTYYKTQEGIVHLNFCIFRGSNTAYTSSETICTLPEGFRPSTTVVAHCGGNGAPWGNDFPPSELHVDSDGRLIFYRSENKTQWVYGEIIYPAG